MILKKYFMLIILVAVMMTGFIGCGANASADVKKTETEAIPVEASAIVRGEISAFITGTASLEAEEEARVVAKVAGVVKRIFVEEGTFVKTGQVMAQLDDDKLSLDLAEAEARLKQLENDARRNRELFEKKIVSQEVFERTQSEYEMQKTKVGQARLFKDYASIRAPFDGIVAERMIKVGNMVPVNEPCFRVTDFDPLLAVLHVPEKDLAKLKKDQDATIEPDAIQGNTFTGKIIRISPVVNSNSGTFKVTIAVSDKERKLKPGMFARVRIQFDKHTDSVLVPKDAVLTEGSESVVFIVNKTDKTARRQIIETGYIDSNHMEVTSGLNQGDTVITTGIGGLKDGSKVEILTGSKPKQVPAN